MIKVRADDCSLSINNNGSLIKGAAYNQVIRVSEVTESGQSSRRI